MNCQKGFIKNALQSERKDNIMKKKIVSAVITTAMLLSSMSVGTVWAEAQDTAPIEVENGTAEAVVGEDNEGNVIADEDVMLNADEDVILNADEPVMLNEDEAAGGTVTLAGAEQDNKAVYSDANNEKLNLTTNTTYTVNFSDGNGGNTALTVGNKIKIRFKMNWDSFRNSKAKIYPVFTDGEGNVITDNLCGLSLLKNVLTFVGDVTHRNNPNEDCIVEFTIDKKTMKYSVVINDTDTVIANRALENSPASLGGLESITMTGTGSGNTYVDDIRVTLLGINDDPELVYSYDFENDTVGKAPVESDVLTLKLNNSSLSKDKYFPVVEKEDINGNMSKMLHWVHNAAETYTDNNKVTFKLGNVEAEYLEYTCDVMIKSENHTGPSFGARDYCYDENGNIKEWGNWGLPACTFGRYNQNWYTKTWDAKTPQFTAAADKWVRLRYIVNTTKNTMTVYYNDTPLNEAVDVAPDRGGQEKNRDIDGWVNFQIYGGRDVKTDFDFYFDNFNVYERKALNFTAQQGNTDVKTTGAELAFVSNREFTTMSDPIVLDSEGKALSQNDYSVTKSNNGFTVKFNNGALKKKSKYTIKVASAEDSKKIGLPDAYLYEFVTEPLAFDATYKVTESGNEVTSLTGLGGKTLNINSINRNYEVDGNASFVSAAVLSDSKGEIKQIIELDSGSLAKGTKSEKDNTLTLPNEDLTGYMLKILTWDSVENGNVLFDTVDIQGKATQVDVN